MVKTASTLPDARAMMSRSDGATIQPMQPKPPPDPPSLAREGREGRALNHERPLGPLTIPPFGSI